MSNTTTLYDYWFSHPDIWFNSTPQDDAILYVLFNEYVPKTNLEQILYSDQIQRHISRHLKKDYDQTHLTWALEFANNCIEDLDKYSPKEIVFILLPFRHTKKLLSIKFCLDTINNLIKEKGPDPYFLRFKKATLYDINKYTEITQPVNRETWSFYDIIDYDSNFDHTVKCTSKVISKKDVPVFPHHDNKCIISISGGVDSMVCLYIAKVCLNLNATAVMINYGNRQESSKEVDFVSWYCHTLSVPFFVRHITEIKRTRDSERSFYEEYTKKVRFTAYKIVTNNDEKIPVILGHNRDDVEENILRNIEKKRSMNNLHGMVEENIIDGVRICRPMLSVKKRKIQQIAFDCNIPYLIDSTPRWSERGRMRNDIIKHIPQTIMDGHVELSKYVSDLYSVVENFANSVYVEKTHNGWSLDEPNNDSIPFWDILFKRLFNGTEYHVTRKSLNNFITISKRQINLKKNVEYKVQLCKNVQIIRGKELVKIIIS